MTEPEQREAAIDIVAQLTEASAKFDVLDREYTKLLNLLVAVITGQVKHEWVTVNVLERSWRTDIPVISPADATADAVVDAPEAK